jgi:mono/diheme cytochrome c family protein
MKLPLRPLLPVALALLSAAPASAAPKAEDNYEKHCAGCHGSDGKAKTRLGRKSGAKDLTDAERMAKLTDTDAFNGIKNGRKNKSGEEVMDAFKDEMSDAEITALVAFVRTLAKS